MAFAAAAAASGSESIIDSDVVSVVSVADDASSSAYDLGFRLIIGTVVVLWVLASEDEVLGLADVYSCVRSVSLTLSSP
jgi:hypothetical protein